MLQLPTLDKIGPEQFTGLFKSTPLATVGQVFNATIVAAALYSVSDAVVIVSWWFLNFLMCSWTLLRWYQNRHRTITRVSEKAIVRAMFSGFLFALPWSLLIIIYLGSVPSQHELLMVIAVVGMAASGSIQLARIFPAALIYLATIFVPTIVKCLMIGELQYYLLACLSISFTVYLISIIVSSANTSIERSMALEALEKFATTDDLTGLVNRRAFRELLTETTNEAGELGTSVGLFICDLDHFKNVNDMFGHSAGDHLLQVISHRLEKSAGEDGIVARLGGDEFAIIGKGEWVQKDVTGFVSQLINDVNSPIDLDGTSIDPGISIGVSIFPHDADSPELLLSHADMALQRGKSVSRGQFWFFDNALRSKLTSDAALEADLRLALAEGQFELFYQPKVEISTGRLYGLESLLRWRRPNGAIVTPNNFLAVAEQRGLMPYISDFVVAKAIDDICSWRDVGLDPGEVSINIHPVQIKDLHRMQRLADDVENAQISPHKFVLEITEECVVGRGTDEVPEVLELMRKRDFKISLDDFGTGYASLTHLQALPVDEIKLDRTFINDLGKGLSGHSIVHALIKLSDSLGLKTVAEGIENQEQHNVLLAMECGIGQGYLYAKPMDLEAATKYLRNAEEASDEDSITSPEVPGMPLALQG